MGALLHMTSVSPPLGHSGGHPHQEISKLGDSLGFSFQECKAPK